MKTSKIIFITLLATIAIFILAAMIDIRINGVRNGSQKGPKVNLQKQTVPSFKVLSVINCINIFLIRGDSSFIEVASSRNSPSKQINYTLHGDTLLLSDIKQIYEGNKYLSVKICSTDSLKSILLKNSTFRIESFKSEKMLLDIDKSSVRINQIKREVPSFHSLYIKAKNNSHINTNEFKVDSLRIVLQNSIAYLQIIAKTISGNVSDNSKLFTRHPEEISLKRDASSKITVNGN